MQGRQECDDGDTRLPKESTRQATGSSWSSTMTRTSREVNCVRSYATRAKTRDRLRLGRGSREAPAFRAKRADKPCFVLAADL